MKTNAKYKQGSLTSKCVFLLSKDGKAIMNKNIKKNKNTVLNCAALVVLTTVSGRCGYEKDGSFTTKKKDKWEMFDAGIAAQTFMLAAHEKGIGSVVLGIFDEDYIAERIGLEQGKSISALIAIGYPAEEPKMPKRKQMDEIVRFLDK